MGEEAATNAATVTQEDNTTEAKANAVDVPGTAVTIAEKEAIATHEGDARASDAGTDAEVPTDAADAGAAAGTTTAAVTEAVAVPGEQMLHSTPSGKRPSAMGALARLFVGSEGEAKRLTAYL